MLHTFTRWCVCVCVMEIIVVFVNVVAYDDLFKCVVDYFGLEFMVYRSNKMCFYLV